MQDYSSFEVVIVDNGSTDDTNNVIRSYSDPRIQLFPSKFNLGVCGGRNRGIRKSKGDVIIIIDDDVEILDSALISKVVARFAKDNETGALCFRIIDYNTGYVDRRFFPSRDKSKNKNLEFETTWVIGAGHAFTREAVNKVGLYRDFRPYGSEEFDFSVRLLERNFKIFYFPEATVLHRESAKARLPAREKLSLSLAHRTKVAILNFPWPNVVSFLVLRSFIFLLRTRFDVLTVARAWQIVFRNFSRWSARRSVIRNETYAKIKDLNGNLYF